MATSSFILVHGAFVDSSCWHKVAPLLRQAGATVATPDNPGASERFEGPLGAVTFEQNVANIERELDAAPKPVILVGHSMAGMIVTQVAENRPDDIAAVVYLSAYLPVDGESLQTLATSDADSKLGPRLKIDGANGTGSLSPEDFGDIFFHDSSPEDKADGMKHQRTQPLQPFGTPVHVTAANYGRVPRYYITTLQDRAVSPALQKRMYERTPVKKLYTIDAGHASFLAHADQVAADLLEIAKG